ncbi:hypothetical protein ACFL4Z_01175 [candidate division KSB1 bacterium]
MICVARLGSKIVIADESEQLALLIARIPGFSRSYQGKKLDTSVIVDLVPDTMEEVYGRRIFGITGIVWNSENRYDSLTISFVEAV